jgi:putative endonuclease
MFYVYVLKCKDGSFYTGYTNNLKERIRKHNEGKAAKYTRSRLPVEVIAQWAFSSKWEAMRHETMFKSLPRKSKMKKITIGLGPDQQTFL